MNLYQKYHLITFNVQQHHVNLYFILNIFFNLISDDLNLGKKKSKISIFAEELTREIKEYDKLVKEEILEENCYDEFKYNENEKINYNNKDITNNTKIFTVYFYLELNKNNTYIFPIESDLLNINTQYGYDLIENIIYKINNQSMIINNNSKQYIFSLKNCQNSNKNFYVENYELRLCKKNELKPKFDLPPFSPSVSLKNILNEKISLICKNSLYIMLLEKSVDSEELNYEKEIKNEINEEKDEKIKIRIRKENIKFDNNSNHNCKNRCNIF